MTDMDEMQDRPWRPERWKRVVADVLRDSAPAQDEQPPPGPQLHHRNARMWIGDEEITIADWQIRAMNMRFVPRMTGKAAWREAVLRADGFQAQLEAQELRAENEQLREDVRMLLEAKLAD